MVRSGLASCGDLPELDTESGQRSLQKPGESYDFTRLPSSTDRRFFPTRIARLMNTPARRIKAVVFDLDGLMFNTEDVFELTGKELLRRRGHDLTRDARDQMLGRRAEEAFTRLKTFLQLEDTIQLLMKESEEIFAGLLEDRLKPNTGLFDLLDHLDERKLPKAVATSSSLDYLHNILNRFQLVPRFLFTLTAEAVTHGKPHPEIYLKAAEQLRIQPAEMLVLEDSEAGTRAASSAGAVVVSIPHLHTEHGDFSCASHIARSLADPVIYDLLK